MEKNHLHILWTNDNPVTAEHMVLLYAKNGLLQKWWNEVTVVIWGATSKLVADNEEIRQKIAEAKEAGVKFSGCLVCAENLGTVEKLQKLGIELKYWGEPLTSIIKKREHILTI